MAGETFTPNMNLVLPSVSTTLGPQWATDINSSLTLIDQHNHTPGYGVQITPEAINMTSALPFLGFSATGLRSTNYTPQSSFSSAADYLSVYAIGVDLYYFDGNGNNVRITQSGAVAGTQGSIANLSSPASATWVSSSSSFVFQANTNVAATLDCQALILRNTSASSYGLTLNPPSSMAANVSWTLPALPGSGSSFLAVSSAGAMTTWVVDNSSLQISSSTLSVKAQGIAQGMLAPKASGSAAGDVLTTSSSGTYTTTSSTLGNVTNLSGSLTTTGRPVLVVIAPASSEIAYVEAESNSSQSGGEIAFLRAGSVIATFEFGTSTASTDTRFPPGSFTFLDNPTAGTYTYSVQAKSINGSQTIAVTQCVMVAWEI